MPAPSETRSTGRSPRTSEPGPTDESLDAFAGAWERFFRAARHGRRLVSSGDSLTIPQYLLIEPLHERSPRSVGELADHAGVSGPTATRMLDGLCRAGWVDRRQSERDRRCVEIDLTETGRRELDARRKQVREYRRRVFEALEPAERKSAERLLLRLAHAIEDL